MLRVLCSVVGKPALMLVPAIAVGAALASCASIAPPVISGSPAPQVVVKTVCPPIPTYTKAQEQALGAAVAALPPSSPLVSAMADYGAVRAAIRACGG